MGLGTPPFSQADQHIVQAPPGYDVDTLAEHLSELTHELQRYADVQVRPGAWYQKWYQPSTPIVPNVLVEDNLGFMAHSVLIDNPTSKWIKVFPVDRYIPPYTVGWILPMPSGGQVAKITTGAPPGTSDYAAVPGEQGWVAWSEAFLPANAGMTIPPGDIFAAPPGSAAPVVISGTPFVNPISDYPANATPIAAASGSVANAAATATLAAAAGVKTWISGFEITASGATAGAAVVATVTGTTGGTLSYIFSAPAGVAVEATPLLVEFPKPIPSSAVNTAIVVSLPALGAGNTNAAVVAHGYQQ